LVLDVDDPEADNPITVLILINTKTYTEVHTCYSLCSNISSVYIKSTHSILARSIFFFCIFRCIPNGLIWSILIQCSHMKKIALTKKRI